MRTRLILTIMFLLSVTSGVILGLAWARKHPETVHVEPAPEAAPVVATGPATEPGRRGSLRVLNLTPEQQEKMRQIWEPLVGRGPGRGPGGPSSQRGPDTQPDARAKRDAAIQALLSPEQRLAYQKIQEDYRNALDAADRERRRHFDDAVEQTKAILTSEQREKYEELLRNRGGRPGGPGFRSGNANGPATRP